MVLNNLLLNIFVNFFAVLSLYAVRLNGISQNLWSGLLLAAATVLCMTFPIFENYTYLFDLRIVPLLFSVLYGGYGVGLFVTAVFVGYRFFLGGDHVWVAMLCYLPMIAGAFYLQGRGFFHGRRHKLLVMTAYTTLCGLVVAVVTYWRAEVERGNFDEYDWLMVGFVLLHGLTVWACGLLYETLRENGEMRVQMRRLEQQEVLGQLAASIAHEVRNPMTVVKGFMQLLERDVEQEKSRQYVQLMVQELNRAEGIIEDYLAFARPHIESRTEVQVPERTGQVLKAMESYASVRGVRLAQGASGCGLVIQGDPNRFSQVLINVIKNGIEAMPDGGVLTVHVYREKSDVCVEVTDTGVGMTRAEVERLGSPFYSTKEKGTGLGMMLAYRIIAAMNGRITVESEKGKGTQVTVRLPVSRGE
ncbi:ATP-binding protein [Tumebacillus sp. DT12]|uniref:histidine kinase n=1 Tax=Tumebacillus lacus TaxID=2995335 RepID=A0ABT3X627_9BACL|nr:ATP-binding protein [Tumebacillus lacus]MCX7572358.1 ATP-binding protein [Tumebacillus lacus]